MLGAKHEIGVTDRGGTRVIGGDCIHTTSLLWLVCVNKRGCSVLR